MSKIFTALKKAQGELASIASPFIDQVEGGDNEEAVSITEIGGEVEGTPAAPLEEAPLPAPNLVVFENRNCQEEAESGSDLRHVQVQQVQIAAASRIVVLTDPRSP